MRRDYKDATDLVVEISIHALRKECDDWICLSIWANICKISIHALRKECDTDEGESDCGYQLISIHALRKECDLKGDSNVTYDPVISIHALRKECDS